MIPSSMITVAVDGERLTCGGFSLDETVRLRNFEFITDYFGSLSLSPRRGNACAAFMGSTRSGAPTPRWAMIEDSTEEFLTMSNGEGSFAPPSQKAQHGGFARSHHNHTKDEERSCHNDGSLWMAAPWPDTGLPFERCHTHHVRGRGGQQADATSEMRVFTRKIDSLRET
jgi:hypothetical protein